MNGFLKFFMSKDGAVAVATLILLTVVMKLNTENATVNFVARTGNLLVFGYILWRAGGKAVVSALSGRREKIAADLRDMESRQAEAARHLAELEQSLSDIRQKRAEILDDARRQAEAVKASLIAKAEAEAEAIKARASKQASSLAATQLATLRAELADAMAKELERMLRTDVSAEQHAALIAQSLNKVVLS